MYRRTTFAFRVALSTSAILFALVSPAFGQDTQRVDTPIKVDVKLVLLPTRVTDPAGKSIVGLGRDDFRILEDGIEQRLEFFSTTTEPAHIAIVVDTSGSTAELLYELRLAAERFVDRFSQGDQIAVYGFDTRVMRVCGFTGDLRKAKRAISWMETMRAAPKEKEAQVIKTGGEEAGTLLYDAIVLVRDEFPPEAKRRAILVFTDSWDVGSETSFDSLAWQVLSGNEMVYAVVADLRQTEELAFLKRPLPLKNPPEKKKKSEKQRRKPMTWALVLDLSGTSGDDKVKAFEETASRFLEQLERRDRVWVFVNRQRIYPLAFPSFDDRPARLRPLTSAEAKQLLAMVRAPDYFVGSVSSEPVNIVPDGVLLLTDPDETGLADLARFINICPKYVIDKCPVAIVKPVELTPEERIAVPYTLIHDLDGRLKLSQRAFASVLRLMESRLNRLARESGGDAFLIQKAGDLNKTYQEIADQIRSSFLLGYYTKGGHGLRRLEVTVPERQSKIRSRQSVIVQ